MDIVLVFPGQGSQKPGMGKDLAESFPAARETFAAVDDAIGAPISKLCFDGPADELTLTMNAQPALYAHGAAAWSVVRDFVENEVVAAAGHSLGELTAHYAAGTFTLEAGARLVRQRGEIMYQVGTERPGAMAAIIGTLSTSIDAICETATRESGTVVPANYNSAQQTVVSGEVAGVERAMELAKAAGAKRGLRLPVSGAFHSPLMEPAELAFSGAVTRTSFAHSAFPVFSNVSAQSSSDPDDARALLVRQLTSPVRWVDEVMTIAATFPDALFVELGPGNVLSGLVSRIAPGARTASCGTAADVEKLTSLLV